MTKKNEPKSPFPERQLEFKEGNGRTGRPAVRPDDKRLTDDRAKYLPFRGNKPGVNGNFQRKPLADALRKKMEEQATAEGKTFAEFWADIVLQGALGNKNLTPSQRDCIQIIRDSIEGKPTQAKEDEQEQTAVFLDDIVAAE
jgi:hypothetical protein